MMREAESYKELRELIEKEQMLLIYLSRPSCGVCTVLRPKIARYYRMLFE